MVRLPEEPDMLHRQNKMISEPASFVSTSARRKYSDAYAARM